MESSEHVWIGNELFLKFDTGRVAAKGLPLRITLQEGGGQTMTYGQGIALGGDFYGVVGAPISTADDRPGAFRAAWASLVNATHGERAAILSILQREIDAVEKAIAEGKQPSTAYDGLGDSLSYLWTAVTMFRYVLLAMENWDHFGEHAVAAYTAGHAVACLEAGLAASPNITPAEKRARLERAYAMNSFADHFMTDLFSTGHLRVPRKELYDFGTDKATLGKLARAMHNEDSRYGLHVRNADKREWRAFGDKMLLDTVSAENRRFVVKAAQVSADEIWDAYQGHKIENRALQLVPDHEAVTDDTTNQPALFVLHQKEVWRRINMSDRRDREWTPNWEVWPTYVDLPKPDDPPYRHVRCSDMASGKFLGWLSVTQDNLNNVGIDPDQTRAHGIKWGIYGKDLYLQKDTKGGDRYLGLGTGSLATWGLWSGWRNPVVYNDDGTVSLASAPQRKLYASTMFQGRLGLSWSDGSPNEWLIRIDNPLPEPTEG